MEIVRMPGGAPSEALTVPGTEPTKTADTGLVCCQTAVEANSGTHGYCRSSLWPHSIFRRYLRFPEPLLLSRDTDGSPA